MRMKFFPFALLVWLSGVLDAQSAAPSCSSPTLNHGYFIPPKESYPHETHIVYVCEHGYKPPVEGWFTTSTCQNGNWSPEPHCIGSSTGSSLNEEDTGPTFTSIHRCGKFPVVENSVAEQQDHRSLKYTCAKLYLLQGQETVVCHSNGKWSDLPTCRENFCFVDTNANPDLRNTGVVFLENGDTSELSCEDKWRFNSYAVFQCKDLRPILSRCCNRLQISTGNC